MQCQVQPSSIHTFKASKYVPLETFLELERLMYNRIRNLEYCIQNLQERINSFERCIKPEIAQHKRLSAREKKEKVKKIGDIAILESVHIRETNFSSEDGEKLDKSAIKMVQYIKQLFQYGSDSIDKIFEILSIYGPTHKGTAIDGRYNYKSRRDYDDKRDTFATRFSWAIPDKSVINKIVKFAAGEKILEIGCGKGLWAGLLRASGAYVTATDSGTWGEFNQTTTFIDDIKLKNNKESVDIYKDHNVLMLIWPPYDTDMAEIALDTFTGNKVIYIGEGDGGCTANDKFHRELESNWTKKSNYLIQTWPSIRDSCYYYTRKCS